MAEFQDAVPVLDAALTGDWRGRILHDLSTKSKNYDEALWRLRSNLRSNVFRAGDETLPLESIVRRLDNRTIHDGFHVLQDWDGKAEKLNKETIPVDVLDYVARTRNRENSGIQVLAILLDYYFVYVLALLALRSWDEGNPNENLDAVTQLLQSLQANGSGQQFAENAETLIFVATSHFEPDDEAYARLLDKVRTLDQTHQVRMARIHSAILASHLRFGFDAQYLRDFSLMRSDNNPDYLWLSFAILTLMRAYSTDRSDMVIEALLNGLTPDTRAFVGKAPASLSRIHSEQTEFQQLFVKHRDELLADFDRLKPTDKTYSPLAFNFNFPHNLFKAMVADALLRGGPSSVTLNNLLSAVPANEEIEGPRRRLLHTLLMYAQASPDMIGGRPLPIITYDAYAGIRRYTKAVGIIKENG
jgi:hypothetical protein